MKPQIIKKLFKFVATIILSISIFVLYNSCQKEISTGILKTDSTATTNTAANSKIVYTDVNPDSVILKLPTDSFKLDLNNDGIADFEFDRSHLVVCGDFLDGMGAYGINLSLKPAGGSNAIMTSGSNYPRSLDSATAIAPDSLWATTSQILFYGATYATGHCISSLPGIRGYWLNVSDKYVGLKFIKGNNTYYGWARLSSSYSYYVALGPHRNIIIIGQLILKDYAYNSIPNQPILAGQTK